MNRKRIIPLAVVFCAVFSFFLSSCGNTDILVLSDHYFYEAGYFSKERMREMKREARKRGKQAELIVIEYDDEAAQRAGRAVEDAKAETVITTPLLGNSVEAALEEIPWKVRLVRLEYNAELQKEENPAARKSVETSKVEFSRTKAFSALGHELGTFLRDINDGEDAPAGAVGMWYTGTEQRKEEYEVFMNAFSAVCSPERLEIERVNKVPDTSAVRNYLEDVRKKDILFGIAFISHQNPELINSYRGLGFGIVSEYLFPLDNLPVSAPVLSVEYPFTEALVAAIELADGEKERITVEAVVRKKNVPGQN